MPCHQICTNNEGSFECSCLDGYQLQGDGHTCSGTLIFDGVNVVVFLFFLHPTDINECLVAAMESVNLCENNQNTQCINNIGSYDCVCVPGYNRVNGSCQRKLTLQDTHHFEYHIHVAGTLAGLLSENPPK